MKIPIFEIGTTTWYQVSTSDFYTFTVTLLTFYSTDTIQPPTHFTLLRKEKDLWEYDADYSQVKKLLIEEIEAWIANEVVVIPT